MMDFFGFPKECHQNSHFLKNALYNVPAEKVLQTKPQPLALPREQLTPPGSRLMNSMSMQQAGPIMNGHSAQGGMGEPLIPKTSGPTSVEGVLMVVFQTVFCNLASGEGLARGVGVEEGLGRGLDQKTVPGRVRVKFAQNRGHEKATKKPRQKPRKSNEKGPNTVFLDRRGPRKSNEKSSDWTPLERGWGRLGEGSGRAWLLHFKKPRFINKKPSNVS